MIVVLPLAVSTNVWLKLNVAVLKRWHNITSLHHLTSKHVLLVVS
jgi:hypothetical protein